MGAPYSLDLRERVVGAVADGMSCAEAAEQYQVSHSSALRWTRRQAATGSPAALPIGGKKPFALADEETWIRERVAEKPDITGRELLSELNARGVEVSYYGVWHFLDPEAAGFNASGCTLATCGTSSTGGARPRSSIVSSFFWVIVGSETGPGARHMPAEVGMSY